MHQNTRLVSYTSISILISFKIHEACLISRYSGS